MAITRRQFSSANASSTAPSVDFGVGNAPLNGSLLVAGLGWDADPTETVLTGWTRLTEITSGFGDMAAIFWKVCGASESTSQAPASGSTSRNWCLTMAEYTGCVTVSPVDVENAQAQTTATKTTPTVTPTASVERLVFFLLVSDGASTWSTERVNASSTGVTELGDQTRGPTNTGITVAVADLIVASTSGTYNADGLCGRTDDGSAHIAMFKAVAGGATAPPARRALLGVGV